LKIGNQDLLQMVNENSNMIKNMILIQRLINKNLNYKNENSQENKKIRKLLITNKLGP